MSGICSLCILFGIINVSNKEVVIASADYKLSVKQYIAASPEKATIESKETLYDFAGNEYALFNLAPVGYLIAHKNTGEVLEANFFADSPYGKNTRSKKYYFGPLSYITQIEGQRFYDVVNETEFEFNESLAVASKNFNANVKEYAKTRAPIGEKYVTKSRGFVYADNHEYFENDSRFPSNYNSSCGYIALAIMLCYLDTTCNDGFVTNNLFFDNGESPVYDDIMGPVTSNFNGDDWTDMSGPSIWLLNELLEYGATYNWLPYNSLTHLGVVNIFDDYVAEHCSDLTYDITCAATDKNGAINKIQNGYPVISAIMSGAEYVNASNQSTTVGNHDVISYGYDSDRDVFMTHFGWTSSPAYYAQTEISNASFYGHAYFEYYGDHVHSSNMNWHVSACAPDGICYCGNNMTQFDHSWCFTSINSTQHTLTCGDELCGYYDVLPHINGKVNYNSTYHKNGCIKCDNSKLEQHTLVNTLLPRYKRCSGCGALIRV